MGTRGLRRGCFAIFRRRTAHHTLDQEQQIPAFARIVTPLEGGGTKRKIECSSHNAARCYCSYLSCFLALQIVMWNQFLAFLLLLLKGPRFLLIPSPPGKTPNNPALLLAIWKEKGGGGEGVKGPQEGSHIHQVFNFSVSTSALVFLLLPPLITDSNFCPKSMYLHILLPWSSWI